MLKIIHKLIQIHKREVIAIILSLLIFTVILSYSNELIFLKNSSPIDKRDALVRNAIQNELNIASKQREEIIKLKTLNSYIKNKDILQLLAISQEEAKNRGIDSIVITDKDGFTLTRSQLPNQRGDNVYETTIQGRKVAKGETTTSASRSIIYPLVFVSASPISENGKTIGGIATGYLINDSYANRFKEKYLQPRENIAFYTPREGVVGDSFQNKQTTQLINTYFSIGSDLVAQDLTKLSKEVKIDNKYYIVHNIILSGIDESPGGVLVFLPIDHNYYGISIATTILIIFFILYYILIVLLKFLKHHKYRTPIIIIFGLMIFIITYNTTIIKLNNSAIEIKKTPYIIYNSTMRFYPESDVIKQSIKKTIAIKIFTGGEAINVVRAVINYNPKILKVVDIITTNSLCDQSDFLNKDIDNTKGQVKIVCHTQNINPGFYEPSGIVAELLVLPLTKGDASIEFAQETQVLANDGLETNVLRKAVGAFYHIIDQELTTNIKDPIPVFSPSHDNSNRWYQSKNIQLAWPFSKDYTYNYILNKVPNFELNNGGFSTNTNYVDLPTTEDGVYYFHLRATNKQGQKSPTSHFKIMIDNTPPSPPNIQLSSTTAKKGDVIRINFTGEDPLSGLQGGFYIKINDGIFLPIKPPFYMPLLKEGDYNITVRIFDKANNFSDNSITVQAIK